MSSDTETKTTDYNQFRKYSACITSSYLSDEDTKLLAKIPDVTNVWKDRFVQGQFICCVVCASDPKHAVSILDDGVNIVSYSHFTDSFICKLVSLYTGLDESNILNTVDATNLYDDLRNSGAEVVFRSEVFHSKILADPCYASKVLCRTS